MENLAPGAENIGNTNVFHDLHDFRTIGWEAQIMENIGRANVF